MHHAPMKTSKASFVRAFWNARPSMLEFLCVPIGIALPMVGLSVTRPSLAMMLAAGAVVPLGFLVAWVAGMRAVRVQRVTEQAE
jgi:hypothetical protein